MTAQQLAKYLYRLNGYMDMPRDILDITQPAADMLLQQQAEIEAFKEQLADCTCQGGHSQAWLKAKGRLK